MAKPKYSFQIANLSQGAQKARKRMRKQYGAKKGEEIWVKRAQEQSPKQGTLREQLNATYAKGSKLKKDNGQ